MKHSTGITPSPHRHHTVSPPSHCTRTPAPLRRSHQPLINPSSTPQALPPPINLPIVLYELSSTFVRWVRGLPPAVNEEKVYERQMETRGPRKQQVVVTSVTPGTSVTSVTSVTSGPRKQQVARRRMQAAIMSGVVPSCRNWRARTLRGPAAATLPLLCRYSAATLPLLCRNSAATPPLLRRCSAAAPPLLRRYSAATRPQLGRYSAATLPLLCRYPAATLPLLRRYSAATLPLLCRYSAVDRSQEAARRGAVHSPVVPANAVAEWRMVVTRFVELYQREETRKDEQSMHKQVTR